MIASSQAMLNSSLNDRTLKCHFKTRFLRILTSYSQVSPQLSQGRERVFCWSLYVSDSYPLLAVFISFFPSLREKKKKNIEKAIY